MNTTAPCKEKTQWHPVRPESKSRAVILEHQPKMYLRAQARETTAEILKQIAIVAGGDMSIVRLVINKIWTNDEDGACYRAKHRSVPHKHQCGGVRSLFYIDEMEDGKEVICIVKICDRNMNPYEDGG